MSTIYDKDPLASIEQLYKDCLSKLHKDMPKMLEVVDRDCRIIEKIIAKKIYPLTRDDLSLNAYGELFNIEIHRMNLRGRLANNRRFN